MSCNTRLPQFLLVLRGPAGAGKTTLAKALQEAVAQRVATIDTDLFNWEIVPGESDKDIVFHHLALLVRSYLRAGYSVIVSGLIITGEEAGTIARLRSFAHRRGIVFLDCYCAAPLELVLQRNAVRGKDIPPELIREWWALAEQDREKVGWPLLILDMRQNLRHLAEHISWQVQRTADSGNRPQTCGDASTRT